ncbi:MAG: hypothetical protein ACK6A5_17325 [Flavobacteriales bacterium]|jgi:hypothetical protein
MKKPIGLALWLLAFLIPFRFALLDTSELQTPEGAENVKGLISFVAMLALLFIGYALVDGSKATTPSNGHGH